MANPLLLVPWLILGIPIVSAIRASELRRKKGHDYAYFVEWKEFPLYRLSVGKVLCFAVLGVFSVFSPASAQETLIALGVIGALGDLVEARVVYGRPLPTKG